MPSRSEPVPLPSSCTLSLFLAPAGDKQADISATMTSRENIRARSRSTTQQQILNQIQVKSREQILDSGAAAADPAGFQKTSISRKTLLYRLMISSQMSTSDLKKKKPSDWPTTEEILYHFVAAAGFICHSHRTNKKAAHSVSGSSSHCHPQSGA